MSVKEIFETMEYGPALEATQEAMQWLQNHDRRFGHFINGAICEGSDHFNSCNPATGEVLAKIAQANEQDVHNAVASARAAQADWAAQSGHQRARVLYAIARLVQKHSRLFATLETLDNGKPIRESRDIDIPLVHRHFYYHAGMAQLMASEPPNRQALGVCGQIIPWNFPLRMLAWKSAPALAMGNSVVLKPAEYTSLTALLFAEICRQAGVPNGVVNIITGDGRVGEHLVNHPDIDKIAFTGSTDVGRKIRQATAGSGKKLTLELGGKSPFIVFDDADLDVAVEGAMLSKFRNAGQTCVCANRIFVQDGIYDAFAKRLAEKAASMTVGSGTSDGVEQGPLIDQQGFEKVCSHVEDAIANGANVLAGGKAHSLGGTFFEPTVLTDMTSDMRMFREETFGPVAGLFRFTDEAEAIAAANDTEFGLAAYLFTENASRLFRVSEALEYGIVAANTGIFSSEVGPFGGVKNSGLGREGSKYGIEEFLEIKFVCIGM